MMRPSSSSSSSCRSSLLPPTPTKPTYVRLGIGGAGNIHKASSLPPYSPQSLSPTPSHHSCPSTAGSSPSSAAGPRSSYQSTIAPLLPSGRSQQQKTHFTSGIGGAGNIHAYTERSAVDAAEEVARARAVALRVNGGNGGPWHVGIGGAGNAAARLRSRKSEAALCTAAAARNERMVTMVREEERAAAAAHHSSIEKEKDVLVSGEDIEPDVRYTSQGAVKREPVSYSAEPLPYGALDLLRRQISQTFGTGGSSGNGNGNRAARVGQTEEKRRNHFADEQQQPPRRTLRSHRSLWRF
ncbi:hypothetical protein IWX90DRAFT_485770 [Phyllosticta citrichinensis]|uniref:Uncharacterized protein n=1 Tax=Phyllosticta citrichinensis TaxID=1130410 RepID=A0ABR1XXB7_9PEZI